ncbi:MAG: tetratricopeptide repeat protein [bacterium]
MARQLRKTKYHYLKLFLIPSFLLLIFHIQNNPYLYSQETDDFESQIEVSFEDKLQFYLNQKSKQFFSDMAVKEKLLLQMIQNITEEIRVRGKRAILKDEIGYAEIFGESDRLIAEYSQELNKLLKIIEEINQLERVVDQNRDFRSWEKIAALREKVVGLLENRELYAEGLHTQKRISEMVQDYSSEVDSVLSFYSHLDKFRRKVKARASGQMQQLIESQKDSISNLLGDSKAAFPDALADQYIIEAKLITQILNEIEKLELKAINQDTDVSIELEDYRRSILKKIDNRFLSLLGYDSNLIVEGPKVSEIFGEWKAKQIANYDVRYTQHEIMKESLLANASLAERSRMLERDLNDAFLNYVEGDYPLAELQFNLILKDYGNFFKGLESVIFFRGECLYARQLFDDATKDYEVIVAEYPDSPYFEDSLFRLMVINDKLGNKTDFYKYFEILKSQAARVKKSCYNKCNYMAGYAYFKDSRFSEAKEALSNVAKDSKYYLMARYLLGIVSANQHNYDDAIEIFKELANRENYPWTETQTTFIRNNSRLKLGYIHYELGDYEKALEYFNSVSPGFSDYDKSLLGAAWANFKQGNYAQTIENVNHLFQDYLASNYTYEALVLSAHCKKLLKQPDSALRDLRYVANARRVLELSDFYNDERKLILDQLAELDQIEEEILERRDDNLYKITSQIRAHLQQMLAEFRHRGIKGNLVLEKFEDERNTILQQIDYLDEIIIQANEKGEKSIVTAAHQQRERLMKVLNVYQADSSMYNVNYLLEYPLATKEGSVKYQRAVLSNLVQQMDNERQRIQENLRNLRRLQATSVAYTYDLDAKLDLEILENELRNLMNRSSQLRVWLAEHQVQELDTNFDTWADFSGFGMNDITFQSIKEKEARISDISDNINSINQILEERRKSLEQRIAGFDEKIKRIEEEVTKEQIQTEKKQKEDYFKESYFDTKEREVEKTQTPISPPK